jgi:hypothetical protein
MSRDHTLYERIRGIPGRKIAQCDRSRFEEQYMRSDFVKSLPTTYMELEWVSLLRRIHSIVFEQPNLIIRRDEHDGS